MSKKVLIIFCAILCLTIAEHQPSPFNILHPKPDVTESSNSESSDSTGGILKGRYEVDEPDGRRRVLEYILGSGRGLRVLEMVREPIIRVVVPAAKAVIEGSGLKRTEDEVIGGVESLRKAEDEIVAALVPLEKLARDRVESLVGGYPLGVILRPRDIKS